MGIRTSRQASLDRQGRQRQRSAVDQKRGQGFGDQGDARCPGLDLDGYAVAEHPTSYESQVSVERHEVDVGLVGDVCRCVGFKKPVSTHWKPRGGATS